MLTNKGYYINNYINKMSARTQLVQQS